jgi:hypothetical protein
MNKGDGIVPTDIYNTVDEVDGEESCSDDDGRYGCAV